MRTPSRRGWLGRALRRPARNDSGFTLIEMLVALMLMTIVMTSCLYAILQGLRLSRDTQQRVVAANVVTGVLEKLHSTARTANGFSSVSINNNIALPSQTVQGTTFKLTESNDWVNRGVSSSVCSSGSNSSLILRSTVTASWGIGGESVSQSTLLAPPNGTLSSSDGALPVQVTGANGSGYSGATVTVTSSGSNPNTQSITTGSDGCAFFAQLPAGTYTVTVNSSTGVDAAEAATYSTTATVSAGTESGLAGGGAISYDNYGTVSWSYSASTPAAATGMPISVDSASQGLSANLFAYTNSSTLTPVYPATYNSVFAGGCSDADPVGQTKTATLFYPTATGNAVTVAAGGSATTTVPLYPLNLEIVTTSNQPVTGAVSPAATPPTAVAGASSLSAGGTCPAGAPTYTLNSVGTDSNNLPASDTGVGLGHLAISVTVNATVAGVAKTLHGSVNVWVKPDGVYATDANGNATTKYYAFTSPSYIPVTVS